MVVDFDVTESYTDIIWIVYGTKNPKGLSSRLEIDGEAIEHLQFEPRGILLPVYGYAIASKATIETETLKSKHDMRIKIIHPEKPDGFIDEYKIVNGTFEKY